VDRQKSVLWILLVLLLLPSALLAEELVAGTGQYYLDPPKGWVTSQGLEGSVQTFTDTTGTAILQVFAFKTGSYGPVQEFHRSISASLGAASEGAPFTFAGRPAVLADLVFQAGDYPTRGYGLFVQGEGVDYALLAFTSQDLPDPS
jgi:hypothetical protein